jgi:hypothetical protein
MGVVEIFSQDDESDRKAEGEQLSDIGDFGGIAIGMRGLHTANQGGYVDPESASADMSLDPNASFPGSPDWNPSRPPGMV